MKLEDQVCSLELSKRLKELGAKQESLFYYSSYQGMPIDSPLEWKLSFGIPASENISAFTVSELLSMLPNTIDIKTNEPFNNYRISMEKFIYMEGVDYFPVDAYKVNYYCDTSEITDKEDFFRTSLPVRIWDINPANALAKMLIHLIENGLICLNF